MQHSTPSFFPFFLQLFHSLTQFLHFPIFEHLHFFSIPHTHDTRTLSVATTAASQCPQRLGLGTQEAEIPETQVPENVKAISVQRPRVRQYYYDNNRVKKIKLTSTKIHFFIKRNDDDMKHNLKKLY